MGFFFFSVSRALIVNYLLMSTLLWLMLEQTQAVFILVLGLISFFGGARQGRDPFLLLITYSLFTFFSIPSNSAQKTNK